MSRLEDDIAKLTDDVLTKADALAAIKIVGEVVGLGAVMAAAGLVISALFGPGGLAAGSIGYVDICSTNVAPFIVTYRQTNVI